MIQCQGCTCAGWLWEGEGGLGDHQPGVYVPLKALFLVLFYIQLQPKLRQLESSTQRSWMPTVVLVCSVLMLEVINTNDTIHALHY